MTSIVLSVLAIFSITGVCTYYVTDRSIRRQIRKKLGQRGKTGR
jgi:hypothetical protein